MNLSIQKRVHETWEEHRRRINEDILRPLGLNQSELDEDTATYLLVVAIVRHKEISWKSR
jgi:hypothetical protein